MLIFIFFSSFDTLIILLSEALLRLQNFVWECPGENSVHKRMESVETCFINLKLCCISIFFHISCCLLLTFFKSDHHFVPSNPFVSWEKPTHTVLFIFQMSLEEDVSIFVYFVLVLWKAKAENGKMWHLTFAFRGTCGYPKNYHFSSIQLWWAEFDVFLSCKRSWTKYKKIRNTFFKRHLKFM